jgi:medium-chain acyl-[acyl-carrier-protein] hydrolase
MSAERWLPFPRPAGPVRLYCLPHAGGSASSFRSWIGALPGVAVCPVQPPGREARFRDTPHRQMEPLVRELTDVVLSTADGPYAVYGHSLGALVAFEVVREIRRRAAQAPVHLFVSGSAAPQCPADGLGAVAEAPEAEVVAMLRKLGGTPDWLLADPTLLELIMPAVRADFSVKETYQYVPEAPLDLPVTVLAAHGDPRAAEDEMPLWAEQTTGPFELHTVGDGHFAVFEHAGLTHKYLAEALRPVVSGKRG